MLRSKPGKFVNKAKNTFKKNEQKGLTPKNLQNILCIIKVHTLPTVLIYLGIKQNLVHIQLIIRNIYIQISLI